jgi:hypothetical protein
MVPLLIGFAFVLGATSSADASCWTSPLKVSFRSQFLG